VSYKGPDRAPLDLMGMLNSQQTIANVTLTENNEIRLHIHCNANALSEKQSQEFERFLKQLPGAWEKSLLANETVFSLSQALCQEILKHENLKALNQFITLGPVKPAPSRPKDGPPLANSLKEAKDEFPPTLADITAMTSAPVFGSYPPIESVKNPIQKSNVRTPPPPRPQGGPPQGGPPPRPQGGPPSRISAIVHSTKPKQLETVEILSNSASEGKQVKYRSYHSDDEIKKMCKEAVNSANKNTDFFIPDSNFKEKVKQILEASIIDKFKNFPDQAPTIEGKSVLTRRSSPKNSV